MYMIYEKLENCLFAPVVINRTIPVFNTKDEAEIDRIYLQPDYENELVVKC